MTEHTYWLTIGRNIDQERAELSDRAWNNFREDLDYAIKRCDGRTVSTIVGGTARWQGEEEDTYGHLITIAATDVEYLRQQLRSLAAFYGQEAIGMVGGPGPSIVTADPGMRPGIGAKISV
jgi:hypothetical protein